MKKTFYCLFIIPIMFLFACSQSNSPAELSPIFYTVTFNTNGGNIIENQSVEEGENAREPTIPIKNNNEFIGWYSDSTLTKSFDFTTPITENITLYALWFVKVKGTTINGAVGSGETSSSVFVEGRNITITNMLVSDHEVTQAEYEKYCLYGNTEPNNTYGKGANYPAYYVSWYDAIVYCNLRSIAEGLDPVYTILNEALPSKWPNIVSETIDGKTKFCGPSLATESWDYTGENDTDGGIIVNFNANGYRLPTEAEFEYIARGGNNGIPNTQYIYSGSNTIDEVAWYIGNSGNKTHEIKCKAPNSLGIYDMTGNAAEWCYDYFVDITSNTSSCVVSKVQYNFHVCSGGGWRSDKQNSVFSVRGINSPNERNDVMGFRLVRTVQ